MPRCDTTYDPPLCSDFYHDQEQSPAVPSPSNPNPDGVCAGTCDCGGVPCGEYLFDHRNGTMLRDWLLNEVIGGPNGVDHPSISGLFIGERGIVLRRVWWVAASHSVCLRADDARGPSPHPHSHPHIPSPPLIPHTDDFWCSNILNGTGRCTDPVQGPTEIDRNSQVGGGRGVGGTVNG